MVTQDMTVSWLFRQIAQAVGEWRTREAACMRELVPLQIFLVMALLCGFKTMVLFRAAKVRIKKVRASPTLDFRNKIAGGYFVHRLSRQNKPSYFIAHLLLTPEKEYHLSSSHHCFEDSQFSIEVCHQIIVLSYSCWTEGTRWDLVFQIFPSCAVLPELTMCAISAVNTVDRKLTFLLETLWKVLLELTYWQISIH